MTDVTQLSDQEFAESLQLHMFELKRRLHQHGEPRDQDRALFAHEHLSRIAKKATDAGIIQPLSGGTDTPDRGVE